MIRSTMDHQEHTQRKIMNRKIPDIDLTNFYIKSGNPFVQGEITELSSIKRLAQRVGNIRSQMDYTFNSGTNTDGEVTLRINELFTDQAPKIEALYTEVQAELEGLVKDAQSKLFSNTHEVGIQEAPLTPKILEAYQAPKADQAAMLDNPNSARHLAALTKLGLLPESTLHSVDKRHSPDAAAALDDVGLMLTDFEGIAKEYRSLAAMDDAEGAERLRSLNAGVDLA